MSELTAVHSIGLGAIAESREIRNISVLVSPLVRKNMPAALELYERLVNAMPEAFDRPVVMQEHYTRDTTIVPSDTLLENIPVYVSSVVRDAQGFLWYDDGESALTREHYFTTDVVLAVTETKVVPLRHRNLRTGTTIVF